MRFFCSKDESRAKDKMTGQGGGRKKEQLAASAKPATAVGASVCDNKMEIGRGRFEGSGRSENEENFNIKVKPEG